MGIILLELLYYIILLEYASTVWCPHTAQNIDSIEAVQRRAARSVMNDWSRPNGKRFVGPSNSTQGSPTIMDGATAWLEYDEGMPKAVHSHIMMYRIVHGIIAIPASSYLVPNTRSTRGHSHKFQVPPASINAFQYSFFPAAIRAWNSLPADVVLCPSIATFKTRLMDMTLTQQSA